MRIKTRLTIAASLPLLMGLAIGGLIYRESYHKAKLDRQRQVVEQISRSVYILVLVGHEHGRGGSRKRTARQWSRRHAELGEILRAADFYAEEDIINLRRLRDTHESLNCLFDKLPIPSDSRLERSGERSTELIAMVLSQMRMRQHQMLAYVDRIEDSIEQRQTALHRSLLTSFYTVTASIALLGVLLFVLMHLKIMRALGILQRGVEIVGSGDLSHRIELEPNDELGRLGAAFNSMSERLQQTLTSRDKLNQEVAERMQAEQALKRLNAELDQLVTERTEQVRLAHSALENASYAVSHNLRTPLRAIDGFSSALLEDYGEALDDTGLDYIHQVQSGCREMTSMVESFITLIRVSRAQPQCRTVDLSAMARAILESCQARRPQRRVNWEVAPGVMARADPDLIRTVLKNLLDNAWKFTGTTPDARIRFSAGILEGETVYQVQDNGVGFDMAHADKLFQPFQRLHRVTEFPGVSMDLAIVYQIVSRHGGRIWAQGEENKGAAFYFTLGSTRSVL